MRDGSWLGCLCRLALVQNRRKPLQLLRHMQSLGQFTGSRTAGVIDVCAIVRAFADDGGSRILNSSGLSPGLKAAASHEGCGLLQMDFDAKVPGG